MSNNPPRKSSSADRSGDWRRYAGLGTQLLVYLGLSVYAGFWLDHRWHCFPLLTVLLPLLILLAIFYKLFKETGSKKS